MVNNIDIVNVLVEGITSSVEIDEYCQKHFNRDLLNIIGVDTKNPPAENKAPFLIYEPLIKNIGEQDSLFEYEFLMRLVISGDERPKKALGGRVLIYEGINQVEELGNLIVKAIKDAICDTNVDNEEVVFYHDEINVFPLYSGTIILRFSIPQVINREQLKFKE